MARTSASSSSSSSPAPSSLRTSSSSLAPRGAGRENSGQSETKGSRPPSASGPGRPKNPVGRPSKQQLRQRELELERSRRAEAGASAGAAGAREEQSPSPSRAGSRGYERPEERVFSASPDKTTSPASSRRPINGALSLLGKSRPTAHVAQARSPSLAKRPSGPPSGHTPSTPPEHSSRGGWARNWLGIFFF